MSAWLRELARLTVAAQLAINDETGPEGRNSSEPAAMRAHRSASPTSKGSERDALPDHLDAA